MERGRARSDDPAAFSTGTGRTGTKPSQSPAGNSLSASGGFTLEEAYGYSSTGALSSAPANIRGETRGYSDALTAPHTAGTNLLISIPIDFDSY